MIPVPGLSHRIVLFCGRLRWDTFGAYKKFGSRGVTRMSAVGVLLSFYYKLLFHSDGFLKVGQLQMTVGILLPTSPSGGWLSKSCSPNAVSFLITRLSGGPISISRISSLRTHTSPPSETFGRRGPRFQILQPQHPVTKITIRLTGTELQSRGRWTRMR